MPSFVLRNIEREPAWSRALTKARADGWSMSRLILQLLEDYAAGRLEPSRRPHD